MEPKCGMIELYIGETVFRQLLGDLYHLLFEQVKKENGTFRDISRSPRVNVSKMV